MLRSQFRPAPQNVVVRSTITSLLAPILGRGSGDVVSAVFPMLAVTASCPLGCGAVPREREQLNHWRAEHHPPAEMLRTWRHLQASRGLSPGPRLVWFMS
jgi:hypothetical protein